MQDTSLVGSVLRVMSPPAVGGWALVLWVVWYTTSATYAWYRLRRVPGPFFASFSYLWLAQIHIRGRIGTAFTELKKYGSLVRVGPNYLVTDDPEVLRKLAGTRSRYTKDPWYLGSKFHPDQDSMLSLLDAEAHDRIKTKTAGGYNGRENTDFEAAVDSQIGLLMDLIRRKYLSVSDEMRSVDFALLSRFFTLDVISRLAFGEAFGHLDDGVDVNGYCEDVDRAINVISFALDLPMVRRILFTPLMLRLYAPKPTDKKGVGKVMAITNQNIGQRFEKDAKPRKDMMGSFIKNGLTRQECENEAILQVLAGSDTTATTIRATMMYLISTPRAYSRLKAEIKESLDRKEVSSPITQAEAKRLPYLQAVIWEGFRIRNPFTYGHYKRVPPEGDTISGIFVPGGTAVGHNTLAMTRKESIFGQDVDMFRPERFLECSEVKRFNMQRTLDIIFGGGRWMCAGKSVAFLELNKIFFELLRAFDFQFVHPENQWAESYNVTVCHTNAWVRITETDM